MGADQPGGATRSRTTVGEWVVVAATGVLAVGSFLPWYTLPVKVLLDAGVQRSFTGWSTGFAPTTLLPLVFALAIAVPTVLERVADLHVPERIAGIRCTQLRLILAAGALLLVVAEMATTREYGPVALVRSPGMWLTLFGAAALLVGVVLDHTRSGVANAPKRAR